MALAWIIVSSAWREGRLSTELQHVFEIPMYKGKGKDIYEYLSYRPLMMHEVCAKLYHMMVINRTKVWMGLSTSALNARSRSVRASCAFSSVRVRSAATSVSWRRLRRHNLRKPKRRIVFVLPSGSAAKRACVFVFFCFFFSCGGRVDGVISQSLTRWRRSHVD